MLRNRNRRSGSYYGHGYIYGATETTRKREGILGACQSTRFAIYPTGLPGDSGESVVYNTGGKALGITSAIAVAGTPGAQVGATIPYALREVVKAGLENVALATRDGGFVGLSE